MQLPTYLFIMLHLFIWFDLFFSSSQSPSVSNKGYFLKLMIKFGVTWEMHPFG